MFWLIATLATAGLGGLSLFAALHRMSVNIDRLLNDAPLLSSAELVEGVYGRIEGGASSAGPLVIAPGVDRACLFYELVVWDRPSPRSSATEWREIHREIVGDELVVRVGDTPVRVDVRQVHLVTAPSHDAPRDLRPGARGGGDATSWVRYVPPDAIVRVAGVVTREVDADPAATNDYREVATRFRLTGTRTRPVVLATTDT